MTGIFLEDKLSTANRMFEFVFKLFGQGAAAIPAKGMGMIPLQQSKEIAIDEIIFNRKLLAQK